MKALSIRQPWAELIVRGIKDVENRGWKTGYRGLLVVHASKTMTAKEYRLAARFILQRDVVPPPRDKLPLGAIVGVVRLAWIAATSRSPWHVHGQWAWELRDPQRLDRPIPCKGQLGLWDVPAEAVAQLEAQLPGLRSGDGWRVPDG